MGPRLAFAPLFRRGGVAVKLLKGAPGADTGLHSHRGLEFTLVLQGGFTDTTGSYGPGDLQMASAETWHNPVADPGEDCINLSVTTAPLRFKGLIPTIAGKAVRLLNLRAAHAEIVMEYIRLGKTGLRVSRICLGTMTYGDPKLARLGAGRGGEPALHQPRPGGGNKFSLIPPTSTPSARARRWWAGR